MKKLFTSLAIATAFSFGAMAQHCSQASNNGTPNRDTIPGLKPYSAELPCIVPGTVVSDTIYFTNYKNTSVQGAPVTIRSLTIDSINNLPVGLCWTTNKASNTFAGGEQGVILVEGTTNAAPGQYKLRLKVSATTTLIPLNKQDPEGLLGLRYYVRVKSASKCCFELDTVKGKTNYFITEDSLKICTTLGVAGINSEISGLEVNPNPFSNKATLSFTSEANADYSVKMINIVGAEVFSKNISTAAGDKKEVTIERNNLSTGIYLLSISSSKGTITKKVIID